MTRKHPLTVAAVGLSILLFASPAFSQKAAPGNKNILIISGDENGTSLVGTSIDDVMLKNRLEVDMGQHVKMMPHDTAAAEMLAAANAADLVIIVESVNSTSVGTKLVSTTTPILSSESFLQDEFGLVVPPFVPVDPGFPGGVSEAQLRAAAQLLQGAGITLNVDAPAAAPAAPGAAPPATAPAGRGAAPAAPGAALAAPGATTTAPAVDAAAPGAAPAGRGARGARGAGPGAAPAGRGGPPGGAGGRGGRGGNPALNAAIANAVANAPKPSHGVTVGQISLVIADSTHPLAAGLSGRVQVYREPREMNWGAHLAPGAKVVATLAPSLESAGDEGANTATDRSQAAVIYYVPKGGELAGGAKAAGLRVQFFCENENGPGTYNLMTAEGFKLFDAAINWALTQK